MKRTCVIANCGKPAIARGWCHGHYKRWQNYGDPVAPPKPRAKADPTAKFWANVLLLKEEDACWPWQGTITARGYGQLACGGTTASTKRFRVYAHIFSYNLHVGEIPDGLVIDHLCHTRDESCAEGDNCRHRRCVNPAHMELVTRNENAARAHHGPRRAA